MKLFLVAVRMVAVAVAVRMLGQWAGCLVVTGSWIMNTCYIIGITAIDTCHTEYGEEVMLGQISGRIIGSSLSECNT